MVFLVEGALEGQEQTTTGDTGLLFVEKRGKLQRNQWSVPCAFPPTQQMQLTHTPPLSKAESSSPRKEILKSVHTSFP